MLNKITKTIFILICLFLFVNKPIKAETKHQQYLKAEVVEIIEEGQRKIQDNISHEFQKVKLKILEGANKNKIIEIEHGGSFDLKEDQKVKQGNTVIVAKQENQQGNSFYFISDKYRLGNLAFVAFIFFFAVVLIGGIQGVGSILGMLLSLIIVLKVLVPAILNGYNPLLASIFVSILIMVSTIYLAHGINKKTHIAVASTCISLILTGVLAVLFVKMALLTGLGSEEAFSLTLGQTADINFKGLLLGGIIIGALGSLDDVTTSQTAMIFELDEVNKKLSFEELIKRGINIGKEHVAGMVNTLILAYVGASLALFLIFYIGAQDKPFWMIANSEVIAEEIIRSLSGSIGLILAVPITTFLSAYFVKKRSSKK